MADEPGVLREPVDGVELRVSMAGLFDVAAEKARLAKELGKIDNEAGSLRKKLDNPDLVARAKPEVVAQARQGVASLEERRVKVQATLDELGRL